MRTIFFNIILLFLLENVNSQTIELKKEWIGKELEYFNFSDTTLWLDYGFKIRKYYYTIIDKNLTICEYDLNTIDGLKKENHYIFEVNYYTKDALVLIPLNKKANYIAKNKKSIELTDLAKIKDSNFTFEKLTFSSTTCYGKCPEMKLEIDSNRKIYFYGNYYTGKYKGFYIGKVKKKYYQKIINSLSISALEKLPPNIGGAIDAPNYEFIYYFNKKRVESKGYFVPYIHTPILIYLLNCYKESKLRKLDKEYKFETIQTNTFQ